MNSSRRLFLFLAFGYLAFVVYGSLVPFDFQPRPIELALRDFARIRYLTLGIDSRADWVANILLYIPLPFLWLSALAGNARIATRLFLSIFLFIFFVALSIAVEFTQMFFPPRTVSLNDLIAEIAGTAIGVVVWWLSGAKLGALLSSLLSQGKHAAYAGLILYAIGYLAMSLFPYDFLISAREIQAKLASDYFHWLAPPSVCDGALRCGAKLAAEAVAAAPLGLLFGVISWKCGWPLVQSAAWLGLWLGLTIEFLQFFIASGTSLGVSVATRVVGVGAGAAAVDVFSRKSLWPWLYLLRPFMPVTLVLYGIAIAALAWSGKGSMLSLGAALDRLSAIRFVPFYYHYYTSEAAATSSLFAVAVMFVPMGAQYWVWRVTQLRGFVLQGAVRAGLIGALAAIAVEFGKLFFAGARPDPTNVLIGSFASATGFVAASVATRSNLIAGLPESEEDAAAR